jgi:hypothetical protein
LNSANQTNFCKKIGEQYKSFLSILGDRSFAKKGKEEESWAERALGKFKMTR